MAQKQVATTAVTKTTKPELIRSGMNDIDNWGVPALAAKDIMIPKILAMQGLSKPVTDRIAKFGEFRESLSLNLLGSVDHPVEFIPFYMEKVWLRFHQEGKKFKFRGLAPVTAETEDLPFEYEDDDGLTLRNYRTMNFYVLLPKDIKEGKATPYLLSFRSTSQKAGQKLAAVMFMKNLKANKTPASMVMELSGSIQSNDLGSYVVMDVKEKRPSTDAEVKEAFYWVGMVRKGGVKVDHSDLEAEASTVVEPSETDAPISEKF